MGIVYPGALMARCEAESSVRYFIDTEFHERGPKHAIDLISVAIVAEDGREFYACNQDFNERKASDWLKENVLPHLPPKPHYAFPYHGRAWMRFSDIAPAITEFIGDDPKPEFWGYFCAYDYVVLSQVMGGMERWPKGWPYLMYDLRQALDAIEFPHITQDDDAPHDALQDARWIGRMHRLYFAEES